MDFARFDFITKNFFNKSKVINIAEIDSGLVNQTYVIEHLYNGVKSKFILQSLSNIFESYDIVNMNHKLITDHIEHKINHGFLNFDGKRWEVPNLIKCKSNNLFSFSFESNIWRAMLYIDDTYSVDFLEDELMSFQTGVGLAKFHLINYDLDSSRLRKSINNFHNTKYYINQYLKTFEDYDFNNLDKEVNMRIKDLNHNLSNHIVYVDFLLKSLNKNIIKKNIIHGDPKLSNFLFDIQFKYVVSLIDLDTVSSGYLLSDLADCIRSICNLAGEDPVNKEDVSFDMNSCKHFLKGYFSITQNDIQASFKFLPEFIYLIIIELTIRFFTDYLQNNRYFKIKYETHNLFRAEVQYRLLSSFIPQIPNLSNDLHGIGISPGSSFVSDLQKFA